MSLKQCAKASPLVSPVSVISFCCTVLKFRFSVEHMFNTCNISDGILRIDKIYEYAYEGHVKVGSPSAHLPASELKITSTVKITGDSGVNYFIQVRVGANQVKERVMASIHTSVFLHYSIHAWDAGVWSLSQQSVGAYLTMAPTGQVISF